MQKKKIDLKSIAGSIGKTATTVIDNVSKTAVAVTEKTKDLATKSQQAVLGAVDQNGNGEIDIEDVIVMGLKVPGIRIDREAFCRRNCKTKSRSR